MARTNKRQAQLKIARQRRSLYKLLLSNVQSHRHQEISQLVDSINNLNDNDFTIIVEQIKELICNINKKDEKKQNELINKI